MDAVPSLYLDMGRIPDYVQGVTLAELRRRADALRQEMNSGWRLTLRLTEDVFQTFTARSPSVRSGDSVQERGVPELPPNTMSHLNRKLFTSRAISD
jgi:hypothetical protein